MTPHLDKIYESNEPLIVLARDLARRAHDSIRQARRYSGRPYWCHTEAVTENYLRVSEGEVRSRRLIMAAAALCHDILEDVSPANPDYSLDRLREVLPAEVVSIVVELTNVYTREAFPNASKTQRSDLECGRLASVSPEAKTIKLADIVDNTKDMRVEDPAGWPAYREEKRKCLPGLIAPEVIGNLALSVEARANIDVDETSRST